MDRNLLVRFVPEISSSCVFISNFHIELDAVERCVGNPVPQIWKPNS